MSAADSACGLYNATELWNAGGHNVAGVVTFLQGLTGLASYVQRELTITRLFKLPQVVPYPYTSEHDFNNQFLAYIYILSAAVIASLTTRIVMESIRLHWPIETPESKREYPKWMFIGDWIVALLMIGAGLAHGFYVLFSSPNARDMLVKYNNISLTLMEARSLYILAIGMLMLGDVVAVKGTALSKQFRINLIAADFLVLGVLILLSGAELRGDTATEHVAAGFVVAIAPILTDIALQVTISLTRRREERKKSQMKATTTGTTTATAAKASGSDLYIGNQSAELEHVFMLRKMGVARRVSLAAVQIASDIIMIGAFIVMMLMPQQGVVYSFFYVNERNDPIYWLAIAVLLWPMLQAGVLLFFWPIEWLMYRAKRMSADEMRADQEGVSKGTTTSSGYTAVAMSPPPSSTDGIKGGTSGTMQVSAMSMAKPSRGKGTKHHSQFQHNAMMHAGCA